MNNSAETFRRMAMAISWAIGLCAALIVGLVFSDLYQRINKPPPFEYSQDVYTPEQANVCPGDTLRWKSSLTVRHTPTVLYSTQVIWSVALSRAWEPSHSMNMFIWTDAERNKPISRQSVYKIPPDLPPGPYELRVGAGGMNTDSDAYIVPFMVGNGGTCPTKRSP